MPHVTSLLAPLFLAMWLAPQDRAPLGALPSDWELYRFGSSGGPGGDWNGDGVRDCLIAAPFGSAPEQEPESERRGGGFLFVFDGARVGHILGTVETTSFGAWQAGGVRRDDAPFAAAFATYGGRDVLVYEPGDAHPRFSFPGIGAGGGFEFVERDGQRWLAVAGRTQRGAEQRAGTVMLHELESESASLAWQTPGPRNAASFGASIALLERSAPARPFVVATSAPGFHQPEDGPGEVFLLAGSDGRVLASVVGSLPGDRYGYDLAAVGDLDGDGIRDLAVGAPGCEGVGTCSLAREEPRRPGCDFPGFVDVLSGRDLRRLRRIEAPERASRFGSALLWLPDRAGDAGPGAGLLVVSAPGDCWATGTFDLGFDGVAVAYDLESEALAWVYRDEAYDHFGLSLFEGCDWDRDGTPEVCSGRGNPYSGAFARGEVCVLSCRTGAALATFFVPD